MFSAISVASGTKVISDSPLLSGNDRKGEFEFRNPHQDESSLNNTPSSSTREIDDVIIIYSVGRL